MIKNKFFPGQQVYFLSEKGYRSPRESGVIKAIIFDRPDDPYITYDIIKLDQSFYSKSALIEGVPESRIFSTEKDMYEYLDGLISAEISSLENQRNGIRLAMQEAENSNEKK